MARGFFRPTRGKVVLAAGLTIFALFYWGLFTEFRDDPDRKSWRWNLRPRNGS